MAILQPSGNAAKLDRTVSNQIDPTLNVKEMMQLAVGRLDDLRVAEAQRISDLMAAEFRRVNEILSLRGQHAEDLRAAEAKRIDAIRAVDVNAVAVASERANAQAQVLVNQVATQAEAQRTLVQTTANTLALQLSTNMTALTDRIAALEKAVNEGTGKSSQTDPTMAKLVATVEALAASKDTIAGRAGLSREMLMLLGTLVGGLIVYLIEHGVH